MLEITIKEDEVYDEKSNRFVIIPERTFTLEHSLISISRWESKWKIPYFESEKTVEQELDYIKCMVVGSLKDVGLLKMLSAKNHMEIRDYIGDPMTATTFVSHNPQKSKSKKEVMTSEVIYSHMFACGIDIECQKWHINRLLTLIKVCSLQNAPKEKMSKKQTSEWNAAQNAARRAKHNSRG